MKSLNQIFYYIFLLLSLPRALNDLAAREKSRKEARNWYNYKQTKIKSNKKISNRENYNICNIIFDRNYFEFWVHQYYFRYLHFKSDTTYTVNNH